MYDVLTGPLANRGDATPAERNADAAVVGARAAMGDLLAADPRGIVFGRSMTQLTMDLARTLAKGWGPGDEVVVTRLDHDSNVRSWVIAAEAVGATVRWADFDPETGELDPSQVEAVLSDRTRLVAFTGASNLLGTMPDVRAITDLAHAAGAQTYVDGVHLVPHAPVDLDALGADFLACSPYKFLGPALRRPRRPARDARAAASRQADAVLRRRPRPVRARHPALRADGRARPPRSTSWPAAASDDLPADATRRERLSRRCPRSRPTRTGCARASRPRSRRCPAPPLWSRARTSYADPARDLRGPRRAGRTTSPGRPATSTRPRARSTPTRPSRRLGLGAEGGSAGRPRAVQRRRRRRPPARGARRVPDPCLTPSPTAGCTPRSRCGLRDRRARAVRDRRPAGAHRGAGGSAGSRLDDGGRLVLAPGDVRLRQPRLRPRPRLGRRPLARHDDRRGGGHRAGHRLRA